MVALIPPGAMPEVVRKVLNSILSGLSIAPVLTGPVTVETVDATATAGPDLILYRDSATPAGNDILGRVIWRARDSALGIDDYAELRCIVTGVTAGAESGRVDFRTMVVGSALARRFSVGDGAFAMASGVSDPGAGNLAADNLFAQTSVKLGTGVATDVLWLKGAGSPEGAVVATVGSMFSRTDGGAVTSLYVKEAGTGNTGWVAK